MVVQWLRDCTVTLRARVRVGVESLNISILVHPSSAPTGLSEELVVCKSVYGFSHLKEHLGLFEKSRGFIPGPGLLSIIISSSSLHRRELTLAVYTALNNQQPTIHSVRKSILIYINLVL